MKQIILVFIMLFSTKVMAQSEIISQEYYEGTLNNNKISMYMKKHVDGCPNVYIDAIYRYNKSKWILLHSTFSENKNQFTFVEHYNTGILLLRKEKNNLIGLWISPDGKKQLKVHLKKVNVDGKKINKLEDNLAEEYYNTNDC